MSLLATLLRMHRERLGWNKGQLSFEIGCDRAYIHRVESDKQSISRACVTDAACALHLDAYDSAQLLAAAGFWPWPDVPFRDVLALLACGTSMDLQKTDTEALSDRPNRRPGQRRGRHAKDANNPHPLPHQRGRHRPVVR